MSGLGKSLAIGLLLFVLVGALVILIGFPYLERRWTPLFPQRPEKPWDLPAGAENVSFSAHDGMRLAGWYLEGVPPRKGITVLLLGGSLGELPLYVPGAEFFRQHGFNVLLFNYRGFGMSDGASPDKRTLVHDAAAAQRYLTNERGIDPHSIAFIGFSIGGPIAASLAARVPCRAVAVVGGIASAKRQLKIGRPWLPNLFLDNLSDPLDAVDMISRAKCPVLVIHAASDTVVPLADAQDVYDAAKSPKRLFLVPGADHDFKGVTPSIYLEKMSSFFLDPK